MRKLFKSTSRLHALTYAVIAVVMVATLAWAAYTDFSAIRLTATSGDSYLIYGNNSAGSNVFSVDTSGNVACGSSSIGATEIADVTRSVPLPLLSFYCINKSVPVALSVTASTAPTIETDDGVINITWAHIGHEASPIEIGFRVPDDYSSAGGFYLTATESDSTTPNSIDFETQVWADAQTSWPAISDQVAIVLAGTTSTPDVITLTPDTDFDSLAAGNWCRLRLWPGNMGAANPSSGDLELKGIVFKYTATQ